MILYPLEHLGIVIHWQTQPWDHPDICQVGCSSLEKLAVMPWGPRSFPNLVFGSHPQTGQTCSSIVWEATGNSVHRGLCGGEVFRGLSSTAGLGTQYGLKENPNCEQGWKQEFKVRKNRARLCWGDQGCEIDEGVRGTQLGVIGGRGGWWGRHNVLNLLGKIRHQGAKRIRDGNLQAPCGHRESQYWWRGERSLSLIRCIIYVIWNLCLRENLQVIN